MAEEIGVEAIPEATGTRGGTRAIHAGRNLRIGKNRRVIKRKIVAAGVLDPHRLEASRVDHVAFRALKARPIRTIRKQRREMDAHA